MFLNEVTKVPGLALGELSELLGVAPSSVLWHARRLEKAGLVKSVRIRQHRVFYSTASGAKARRDAITHFALRHEAAAKCLEAITHHPGVNAIRLARLIHEPVAAVRAALTRLAEAHLVEGHKNGRSVHYHVRRGW